MLACRLHVTLFAFSVCCVLLILFNDATAFQLQEYRRHQGHDEEPYELHLLDSDSLMRVKRGSNHRRNGHGHGQGQVQGHGHSYDDNPVTKPDIPLVRSKRIKRQAVSTIENGVKPLGFVAIPPEKSQILKTHKDQLSKEAPKETSFKEDSMLVKEDSRFIEPQRSSKHRQEEGRKYDKGRGSNSGKLHRKMKIPKDGVEKFEPTEGRDHHHHRTPNNDRDRLDLVVKNAVKQAQREQGRGRNRPKGGGPKKVVVSHGYNDYENGRLVLNNATSKMRSSGTQITDKGLRQRGGNSKGGHRNPGRPHDGNGIPVLDHHHHHESRVVLSSNGDVAHYHGGGKKQSKQHRVKIVGETATGGIRRNERKTDHELHRMKRMQRDLLDEISHLEHMKTHRVAMQKTMKLEKKKKRAVH